MGTVTGVVKAVSSNKFGHGILVEDKWYNSKFPIPAEKGDEVTFDDGGKNYIKGLKKTGGGAVPSNAAPAAKAGGGGYSRGTFPLASNDGSRSIVRQNSVTNAVNLVSAMLANKVSKVDEASILGVVFHFAREFEKYSSGDIDKEIEEELDSGFTVE